MLKVTKFIYAQISQTKYFLVMYTMINLVLVDLSLAVTKN